MTEPREYCHACGQVTATEIKRGPSVTFYYCADCHRLVDMDYDDYPQFDIDDDE